MFRCLYPNCGLLLETRRDLTAHHANNHKTVLCKDNSCLLYHCNHKISNTHYQDKHVGYRYMCNGCQSSYSQSSTYYTHSRDHTACRDKGFSKIAIGEVYALETSRATDAKQIAKVEKKYKRGVPYTIPYTQLSPFGSKNYSYSSVGSSSSAGSHGILNPSFGGMSPTQNPSFANYRGDESDNFSTPSTSSMSRSSTTTSGTSYSGYRSVADSSVGRSNQYCQTDIFTARTRYVVHQGTQFGECVY